MHAVRLNAKSLLNICFKCYSTGYHEFLPPGQKLNQHFCNIWGGQICQFTMSLHHSTLLHQRCNLWLLKTLLTWFDIILETRYQSCFQDDITETISLKFRSNCWQIYTWVQNISSSAAFTSRRNAWQLWRGQQWSAKKITLCFVINSV